MWKDLFFRIEIFYWKSDWAVSIGAGFRLRPEIGKTWRSPKRLDRSCWKKSHWGFRRWSTRWHRPLVWENSNSRAKRASFFPMGFNMGFYVCALFSKTRRTILMKLAVCIKTNVLYQLVGSSYLWKFVLVRNRGEKSRLFYIILETVLVPTRLSKAEIGAWIPR